MKNLYYYIRYIFALLLLIIDISFESLFLIMLFSLNIRKYNYFRHYHRWAKRVLFLSGVKLEIRGIENYNPDETYIFASNHSSQFDIPIIFAAIKSKVAIIYKKELEKIPIFGWKLNKSFFISIDRTDARKSLASVLEALKLIKKGISIIIYPEGTRSVDGSVQEFKRGTFILAAKSGKQIIPVTIVGSDKILPRNSLFFKPGKVQVVFHKPYTFSKTMNKDEEMKALEDIRKIIISGFDMVKKDLAIS